MKKEQYYSLREDFGVYESVSQKAQIFHDFLKDYPMFRNKTIQECLDYFKRRVEEQEARIKETLNVKD